MIKFDEIVFDDREPSIDDMITLTREAMEDITAQADMKVWPWSPGEVPSLEDIKFHYKDNPVTLKKHYLQACLLLRKPVYRKYEDRVRLILEPEKYFKQLDDTEKQLKITFELFLSTENPTLEQAAQKLIQLAGDYWGEALPIENARKQVQEAYPHQIWK